MKKRKSTTKIVIHHSASAKNTSVETIKKWHTEDRGWSDIGYHYVVRGDTGEVFPGRKEELQGAHCPPLNPVSIGICLTGNYETEMPAKIAWDSLITKIDELLTKYNLTWKDVTYHREHMPTACPGKNLILMINNHRMRH